MQHDPNEHADPMGDSLERERSSQRQSTGAAGNHLDADLSDTTGDRSASAYADTSGTLGKESLGGGGGASRLERRTEDMKDTARDKLNATKEKAYNLKSTLADKLEQGADKLRHKASTTTVTEVGADTERKARKASDKVAAGMENTAGWLRNTDVDSMKSGLESQVRSNPGRTLLVALGLGYVVGRLFRGGRGS